jgi:subtilisin family serine protease
MRTCPDWNPMVNIRIAIAALTLLAAISSDCVAQGKKRVERADDLPRFHYPVSGNLEQLVRDDARFAEFAAPLRRDIESVLAGYDIADKAIERQLLSALLQLDWLEGRHDEALKHADQIRALQDKPADKLLSGIQVRAMAAARKSTGSESGDEYRKAFAANIAAELKSMPYDVIANDIKGAKGSWETYGETLVLGRIKEILQPVADKAGALSSDLASRIIAARYGLNVNLPLKRAIVDTYGAYLAANKVDKPDIWAARNVKLKPRQKFAPVRIAVWDSGLDSKVFRQLVRGRDGKPLMIAFDLRGEPSTSELYPLPAGMESRLPKMRARTKGFSDLRSNVDSPEATEVKLYLSELKPDEYKKAIEEITLAGAYNHGTHVGGIAVAGNPYARLVNARIEFDHKLVPDPCPTRESIDKEARNMQSYVDFMKKNDVRVVNMSWSESLREMEGTLEQCGIGKTVAERKTIAREYLEVEKSALQKAIASAPGIVFVAAAGNENSDSTFGDVVPAGLSLPNLITVGAVDKAGDEAGFTSYGPTVVVHANGYQVNSFIPGGVRVPLSGTSMSAPQVANLAGKMLAVNPKLTPTEVIAIIRETADKSADGRRTLIHPAKAVAAATKKA